MILKVCDLVSNFQIGDIIPIALDHKHKYLSDNELDHKKHLLNFISSMSFKEPYIYLFGNFMEADKITYVKKGDGDY